MTTASPIPGPSRGHEGPSAFGVEPNRARYRLRLSRYHAMAEAIADFVKAAPSNRSLELLDVGVGNGRTLRYLEPTGVAERISFSGIDSSRTRLESMYNPGRWSLTEGDVTAGLPFSDQRFDIVVCEQVLEHLEKPLDVVREMKRVLRPGGLLVTGVPIFPPMLASVRRHLVPRLDRFVARPRGHVQTFSKRSFARLIEEDGELEIDAIRGFRIVSGGVLSRLEDYRWWWRFNRMAGRALPSLCVEIQVLARRRQFNTPA